MGRGHRLVRAAQQVDAEQAQAAIAQVSLVRRTEGVDPAAALAQADADPLDLAKATVAADIEVAGGRPEAAFDRLLAAVGPAPTISWPPPRMLCSTCSASSATRIPQ